MSSDFEIKGTITLDDKASRVLQNVGRSAENFSDDLETVGRSAKNTTRSLDDLENASEDATDSLKDSTSATNGLGQASKDTSTKVGQLEDAQDKVSYSAQKAGTSARDLTVGLSGIATSAFSLFNAYDRVADMQLNVDRANLKVQTSANLVEDAQRRQTNASIDLENSQEKLTAIIEKYGAGSAEAANQTEIVNQKLAAYTGASQDALLSTEKYDLAVDNAKQTQDNFNEAIIQSAIQIVPTAITLVDNISKVADAFTNLKNYDFSALINKFTGKGGIADNITSVEGNVGGLSGKLGGLNGISFGALIGGLAAVAAAAYSAYYAIQETRNQQAIYEAAHGTQMSTAETAGNVVKNAIWAIPETVANEVANVFGLSAPTSDQRAIMDQYSAGYISKEQAQNAFNTGDYASTLATGLYQAGQISQGEYLNRLTSIARGFSAANGFEGITKGPTMFLAGEGSEQERVSIQPLSKSGAGKDIILQAQVTNHFNITGGAGSNSFASLERIVRSGTADGLVDAINQRSSELRRRN